MISCFPSPFYCLRLFSFLSLSCNQFLHRSRPKNSPDPAAEGWPGAIQPGFSAEKTALLRIVKASHCRKKRLEFRTGLKSNNYYIK